MPARSALSPAPVNAALVLAPRVVLSASMDVVLRGREGEAKCLHPLVFGLIFFPFSYFISSLTECWRGAWGSRRSGGVTGGKGARLVRRDARNSCAVLLSETDFFPSHKELIIVLSRSSGRMPLPN